jgi:hypothetical protein
MRAPEPILNRDQARALRDQLIVALREMGIMDPERTAPRIGWPVEFRVDYPNVTGYRHSRVPDREQNWGVVLITGESRHSEPPKRKRIYRELAPMLERVAVVVNARRKELMRHDDNLMDIAQRDFDRGWCAHRRGITCKLINNRFHALVRVGAEEVWQDDVEYSTSHDTLVFKSDIGKVDRWITIEALQKLLDLGVLLNPKDVKFATTTD